MCRVIVDYVDYLTGRGLKLIPTKYHATPVCLLAQSRLAALCAASPLALFTPRPEGGLGPLR
jgi:hypothetical protein